MSDDEWGEEYDVFTLQIDGEYVDHAQYIMPLVAETEKIIASYIDRPMPRIEILDCDENVIMRRAYPHEEVEDPNWPWKEGLNMRLVTIDGRKINK